MVGALSGAASAADQVSKEIFIVTAGAADIAPLEDLDKLRARGPQDELESSSQVREAIRPLLLIFLLRQNRLNEGADILRPVVAR